jgi:hypothetical protein
MDAAFRALLHGTQTPWMASAEAEDLAALRWAVDAAQSFAEGQPIEAREKHLRVRVLGMTGTADALCRERGWSADLKAGEVRDYEAQQAAYALGFMNREGVDRWTVHLLFCDAREVATLEFTRESAERLLRELIARVKDPHARATPCEYCDWCALRWKCAARLEPLSLLVFGAPDMLDVASLAGNPTRLGTVLSITHEIAREDGLHDVLKQAARTHLEADHDVAGWSLARGRESHTVEASSVARYATELGVSRVIDAYGAMSSRKFANLWNGAFPGEPMPDDVVQTHNHPSYLSRRRARS